MSSLAQGETAALGALYARYGKLVQGLVHRAWGRLPSDQVEDLCHEVFLAVYDAAPGYVECGKLSSWLVSVALRTTRMRRRQTWRQRDLLARFFGGAETEPRSPETQVGARLAVARAVAALPEMQREVLFLHVAENLTAEEIAAALGIRPNTVWTRLHRARRAMLRALADPSTNDRAEGASARGPASPARDARSNNERGES